MLNCVSSQQHNITLNEPDFTYSDIMLFKARHCSQKQFFMNWSVLKSVFGRFLQRGLFKYHLIDFIFFLPKTWTFWLFEQCFLIYRVIRDIQNPSVKIFNSNVNKIKTSEPGFIQCTDFCFGNVCKLVNIDLDNASLAYLNIFKKTRNTQNVCNS